MKCKELLGEISYEITQGSEETQISSLVMDSRKVKEGAVFVCWRYSGQNITEDTKVTDMLYKCYAEAEEGKNFDKSLKAIKERYNEIIKGLGLKLSLEEQFETIKK